MSTGSSTIFDVRAAGLPDASIGTVPVRMVAAASATRVACSPACTIELFIAPTIEVRLPTATAAMTPTMKTTTRSSTRV